MLGTALMLTWLVAMFAVYIWLGTTLKGHPRAFEATGAFIQLALQFWLLPSLFTYPIHSFDPLRSSPNVTQDELVGPKPLDQWAVEQQQHQHQWLWIAYHVATVAIFAAYAKAGMPRVLDRFVDVLNRYSQLDHWWMWAIPSPAPIFGWLSWLSMTGAVDVARDPLLPSAIDSIMTDTLNRRKTRLQWASRAMGWTLRKLPLGPPPTEVAAQKLQEAWWNGVVDYTLAILAFWFLAGVTTYLGHGAFAIRVLRLTLMSWSVFFYTPMVLLVFLQLPRLAISLTSTLLQVFNKKLVYPILWSLFTAWEYGAWCRFFFPDSSSEAQVAAWCFALQCCAVAYPILTQLANDMKAKQA